MSVKVKQKEREAKERLADDSSFDPNSYDYEDAQENPPDLERFYGPLKNYVKMITGDYHKLFMLDAKGGLGKTYNVRETLKEELPDDQWTHQRGFTTPVELYKTLWKAQEDGHVLFLDDMSGFKNNQKAIDMLKAATESDGEENWIEYRSSRGIDHPYKEDEKLEQTFCFRGSIIMSFNDTPDNEDFNALKDRGVHYELDFDYPTRLDLIREVAKLPNFSPLTVEEQQEVAEWVATVTDPSIEVSLRTFEEVCNMRNYGQLEDQNWQRMAFEVFNLDYEKYLIIRMMDESDMKVKHQIQHFKEETGRSKTYYYQLKNKIKSDRMA